MDYSDSVIKIASADTLTERRTRPLIGALPLFCAATFLASALLFLVQPMFARLILPRLGGSPAVWNTCVVFFQAMLLAGYVYAHFSIRWLGVRRQALLHLIVVMLPIMFLPLTAGAAVPREGDEPVRWLLGIMATTVGVPFFVISTSAPLFQRWFSTLPLKAGQDPYFLYSASNAGSMLALLAYPFVLEPLLGVRQQTILWTSGYFLLAAVSWMCAWMVRNMNTNGKADDLASFPETRSSTSVRQRLTWIAYSSAPSSLMLGVTLHISTDIGAVPLLWIVPLAIYLFTYVIAFSPRALVGEAWTGRVAPYLVLACLFTILLNVHDWWFIPLHLVAFFCCALVCHRRLADTRPAVNHLTEFYLWISVGGALGGVLNTLVAPAIMDTVFEYPLVLAAMAFLIPLRRSASASAGVGVLITLAGIVAAILAWVFWVPAGEVTVPLFAIIFGLTIPLILANGSMPFRVVAIAFLLAIGLGGSRAAGTILFTGRSFFGVSRVIEARDHSHRVLRHGSTLHGWQALPSGSTCEASSYYHPRGPIGQVIEATRSRLDEVAVIGLGTGTLACHAEAGEHWTFYEIDPLMEKIARNPGLFTQLQNSPGTIDVVIVDGRIGLQRVEAGRFDLLIVDAFSSDAIPVHLLTQEAIRLYVSRLKPQGLLAIHISNRYLELEPLVVATASHEGLTVLAKLDTDIPPEDRKRGRGATHWLALARDPSALDGLRAVQGWRAPSVGPGAPVWTDDYSNILEIVKLR